MGSWAVGHGQPRFQWQSLDGQAISIAGHGWPWLAMAGHGSPWPTCLAMADLGWPEPTIAGPRLGTGLEVLVLASVVAARTAILKSHFQSPARYIIFNHRFNHRMVIEPAPLALLQGKFFFFLHKNLEQFVRPMFRHFFGNCFNQLSANFSAKFPANLSAIFSAPA